MSACLKTETVKKLLEKEVQAEGNTPWVRPLVEACKKFGVHVFPVTRPHARSNQRGVSPHNPDLLKAMMEMRKVF